MQEFFTYLNTLHPLSDEATAALLKIVKVKEYRRGQVVLQEGATCDRIYFVLKGMLKLYFEIGTKEVILQLAKERECLISAQSYFDATATKYSIQAQEASTIIYLTKSDLDHLVERMPELNKHFLRIGYTQIKLLEEHSALLMLPPVERFTHLMKTNSWITQNKRVTDRLLASYLGVRANTVCEWKKV